MLHRTAPFRFAPDEITKTELDSAGLGDPTASLRRGAVRDSIIVGLVFIAAYIIASIFDIGDWYREASVKYEDWEFDEIAMAAIMSTAAFCWFSWRQWQRYRIEVQRRLKLEESMIEMRVMADHLGDNKSLFLANLAHDFRTPLNGILGFSQLMNELPFGSLDEDRYKSYVQSIHESAQMLGERIETCLDPDKIEFGAEPMQMISYPLKTAVNKALPIVQSLAESAQITLIDSVSDDLPHIHGDARALKKIIVNLVTNAIRHGRPKGRVEIAAEMTANNSLCLVINDNGVGMDTRMLAALADGKRPAPSADDEIYTSTSVGLSVVKKLLDLHEAALAIKTGPKLGTSVSITFPPHRVITAPKNPAAA